MTKQTKQVELAAGRMPEAVIAEKSNKLLSDFFGKHPEIKITLGDVLELEDMIIKTYSPILAQAQQEAREDERRQIMREAGAAFVNWDESLQKEQG